jgi:hypothetical protein
MNEKKDVDAYLRVYRKAILTNNTRAIVESVGRLVEIDSAQDWSEVLAQAEEDLQGEMGREYRAAKEAGDEGRARQIEDEFAGIEWSRPVVCAAAKELVEVIEARKREAAAAAAAEEARLKEVAAAAREERARQLEEEAWVRAEAEEEARRVREAEEARQARWKSVKNFFSAIFVIGCILVFAAAVFYFVQKQGLLKPKVKAPERVRVPVKEQVVAPVKVEAKSVITNAPPSPNALLKQLKVSRNLDEVLRVREELRGKFSGLEFVKEIRALSFSREEALQVLEGGLKEWHEGAVRSNAWTSAALFSEFVTNQILSLASKPMETELYAFYQVVGMNSAAAGFLGLACGKPTVQIVNGNYSIEGKLFEFYPAVAERSRIWAEALGRIEVREVAACEEVKGLIEFVQKGNVSAADLENELLRLIEEHAKKAEAKERMCPAYRRVQLVARYLSWLDCAADLRLEKFAAEAARLGEAIGIEGLPKELEWVVEDVRVEARNQACCEFLKRLEGEGFVAMYREVRAKVAAREARQNWKVKFVGRLNCPSGEGWRKNPTKFYLSIFDEKARSAAPLYVLRKDGGRLILKRVLERGKNGKVQLTSGMGKELYACDPLFQVLDGTQTVDLEKQ